ncbi:MAG: VIT1/CCC1 transporter family protein, partial [Patescibacteria group bacterium]
MTADMRKYHPEETRERHIRTGRYLKDIIFGANDGIITTFAVVAATVGGGLSPATILIVGFANLFADGFSMATGNYLGTKSEIDFYKKEEAEEYREVKEIPEKERQEIRDILSAKGYAGADLEQMTTLICSNEKFWVDFMMREELNLNNPEGASPMINGLITFAAFVGAGVIPLLPYLALGADASFRSAVVFTAAALFAVGALRHFFSRASWFVLGLEMLAVGGTAAGIAYGIGFAIKTMV